MKAVIGLNRFKSYTIVRKTIKDNMVVKEIVKNVTGNENNGVNSNEVNMNSNEMNSNEVNSNEVNMNSNEVNSNEVNMNSNEMNNDIEKMEEINTGECENKIIKPSEYKLFDVDMIDKLPTDYPEEFKSFCEKNGIKPPKITTSTGIAWSLMTNYPYYYFNREVCEKLKSKFGIKSNDIIQQFNKVNQKGIKSNSDLNDKGKSYIVYPYSLSNKHKMRKNFGANISKEDKDKEIEKIKQNIKADYIDVSNYKWQLGHKNPGLTDNTNKNMVLQPPIQSKYRDDYIFIDSLTKFPTPKKLKNMIANDEIEFSASQVNGYMEIFTQLSHQTTPI
jgi:hypothetical protein